MADSSASPTVPTWPPEASPTHVGGIDIGGTKVTVIVANVDGPLRRLSVPTVRSGPSTALADQVAQLLHDACAQAGVPQPVSVGVSSCGPFSRADNLLTISPPNICGGLSHAADLPNDWESIPLERVLRGHFANVKITNDAVAALQAERLFGAVQNEPDCVYVTWSTGVGMGFCVDGHILAGKHGNAGHGGHMLLSETADALCGCGNRGDLEALVAGRNLANRVGQPTADVFAAARNGDAAARGVVLDAARWLGRGLYNVVVMLDIRSIVIGGSIWQHHGEWLAPIVMQEITSRFAPLTGGVRIVDAALGSMVADIGALSLVMPDGWKPRWRENQPWRKTAAR